MDKRSVTINHKKINNLPSEVYAGICIKRDSGAYLNYD